MVVNRYFKKILLMACGVQSGKRLRYLSPQFSYALV